MKDSDTEHFLTRPRTIRWLWLGLSFVLALTLLVQLVVYTKGYFIVDGWFGFGAIYGFISCLIMVLVTKILGALLKRPRNYYPEHRDDV